MTTEKIKKAAVVGSGAMGHGIAQLLAMTGCEATTIDISQQKPKFVPNLSS